MGEQTIIEPYVVWMEGNPSDNACELRFAFGPDPSNSSNTIELKGDYQVDCTTTVWVMNPWDHLGDAIGDAVGGFGMAALAMVLFVVGAILACVACCCCFCTGQQQSG